MTYETIESTGVPIKAWTRGVPVEDSAKQQLRNVASLPCVGPHVAVMPDVHLGYGATVGSVVPTRGAIIPGAVGVDIGCFTGDTTVPMLDGSHRRLDDLAARADSFLVWSITSTDRIVAASATARRTRHNADLVRVTIDNGESVRCTPDHRFMLRDGTFREARDLAAGDSLMPMYSKTDRDGYTMIAQPYSGRWQRAHWMVARSGALGPVPKFEGQRTIVHHKNFTQSDNSPENLAFMGHRDHARYHRSLVERNTAWQSQSFEAARVAAIRAKADTDEGRRMLAERGTRNLRAYMTGRPEHFAASVAGNGARGARFLIAYNRSERGRKKSAEVGSREYTCPHCGEVGRSGFFFPNHIARCAKVVCALAPAPRNHKIVSVEPLAEREDVYCLTVPGLENFALSCGVFVHNCGMCATRTSLRAEDVDTPQVRQALYDAIVRAVPHGSSKGDRDVGAWTHLPERTERAWAELAEGYKRIVDAEPFCEAKQAPSQLGTLGGGNHFVEVCLDLEDRVWLMLHSGSRGVGNRIGVKYTEIARDEAERNGWALPDRDLGYLVEGSDSFDRYVFAVGWAQRYARLNRDIMRIHALTAIHGVTGAFKTDVEAVNCHHNYVEREEHFGESLWLTRKGAVSARAGELGIIPGSMGTRSFIVRGKGNADSFHSCSHGAGRVMARGAAKRAITVEQHAADTAGIICRKDAGVVDESPRAYKPIEDVMRAQSDLVEVVAELRQILCVKG